MTQEDYIQTIHKQQSFIRRLFKRRKDISAEIESTTKEYYKDLIGKFFYVSPEDRDNKFKTLSDGYYFVAGVSSCSNYVLDDKVEVNLNVKYYGYSGSCFEDVVGIDVMVRTLRFAPSTDMKSKIEPLIVSREQALKPLQEYYDKMIKYFTKQH